MLRAVGLWTTRVDEGVNGRQDEALLVELLQLAGQLAHRRETQRGRPAYATPKRGTTRQTKRFVSGMTQVHFCWRALLEKVSCLQRAEPGLLLFEFYC